MRVVTPQASRAVLTLLSVAAILAFAPGLAHAVNPLWDHYKVYTVDPHPTNGSTVLLQDQFQIMNHQVQDLEFFMNPTEKITSSGLHFTIYNPLLHYSWWRISPSPFGGIVSITNQFGPQVLNVHDAVFLLNPALKNSTQPAPQPPTANHYKCYLCDGQPLNQIVTMIDQFGSWQATLTFPKFFCNPVQKTVVTPLGQTTYPIVDPLQHYTCYLFNPIDPSPHSVLITDQFLTQSPLTMSQGQLICVPTDKDRVVPTKQSTWGRLKMIYR